MTLKCEVQLQSSSIQLGQIHNITDKFKLNVARANSTQGGGRGGIVWSIDAAPPKTNEKKVDYPQEA